MRKMVVAVVPRDLVNQILEPLISAGFGATFSESRGGVMRQAQEMLFIAVDDKDVPQVRSLIRDASVGEDGAAAGVVLFVWPLDAFEVF